MASPRARHALATRRLQSLTVASEQATLELLLELRRVASKVLKRARRGDGVVARAASEAS